METMSDYDSFRAMLADPVSRKQLFELAGLQEPSEAHVQDFLLHEGRCQMLYAEVSGALQARAMQKGQEVYRGQMLRWLVILIVATAAASLLLWNIWRAAIG